MIDRSIKAIAFDAFGTLVTPVSRAGPYQRLGRSAAVDAREFRLTAMTADVDVDRLASNLGRNDLAAELVSEVSVDAASVELFADAAKALGLLKAAGIPYVLCSNLGHGYGAKVRELTPDALGHVFSYECGAIKPDPAIYHRVLSVVGVQAHEVLFVGDTPKADYDGPKAFGMQAALVDRKSGKDLLAILSPMLSDASSASSIG